MEIIEAKLRSPKNYQTKQLLSLSHHDETCTNRCPIAVPAAKAI